MLIEYRDPLFGIIIFFLIIFITSFITYSYSLYRQKLERSEYKSLLNRFEVGDLNEQDYIHLYKTYKLPFESIMLLASTFLHEGKYNKAITVYSKLLEIVDDQI